MQPHKQVSVQTKLENAVKWSELQQITSTQVDNSLVLCGRVETDINKSSGLSDSHSQSQL